MRTIATELTKTPKDKPQEERLGFGQYFTDHMFISRYVEGKGWDEGRIIPYGPIEMDPAAMVLHYGQAVFEGLKCYRAEDGRLLLFRPDKNFERLNNSDDRLCIPYIDPEFALDALTALIRTDAAWVPSAPGTSLYIRPFTFATDPALGVRVSHTYSFIIILSPVGAYYATGLEPVSICIENEYVRAVRGGLGFTKAAANYASSLKGQEKAKRNGFSQVLWLDGVERKYIEEVGTMNVFFRIGDEVVTPSLEGSILPGITRDSVIQLLKSWGITVTERRISVTELCEAHEEGRLQEAFGTGTAAVISPIGALDWEDRHMKLSGGKIGPLAQRLYDNLTGIQYGRLPDSFGWVKEVK